MTQASFAEPTPASEFYARDYRQLSDMLRTFASTYQMARKPGHDAACLELINIANLIFARARSLISSDLYKPLSKLQHPSDFINHAIHIQQLFQQSTDPTHQAIGVAVGEHVSYARTSIKPDDDGIYHFSSNNLAYLRDCSVACVQILTDRLFNSYQWFCPDPRQASTFFDSSQSDLEIPQPSALLLESVKSLEGWCSDHKAALLYTLARNYNPRVAVEIGIYGGRSIIPIAAALRDNEIGHVYGIETWSGSAATSYRTNFSNDFWWLNIDFNKIKSNFLRFTLDHGLHEFIRIIEAPSDRCAHLFDVIDFLHIDGGHSTYGAALDVVSYVSKVPSGGIIVYDDINWPSTSAGLDILRDCCQLLHVVPAYGSETEPGCAAFIKV